MTDERPGAQMVQEITFLSAALALVARASGTPEGARTDVGNTFVALANLAFAARDWGAELRLGST